MARAPIPLTVLKPIGFGRLAAAAGASVQVNLRSGGAASVYSAETAGSVLSNPLTSDAQGRVTGWVERGAYNLVVSHPDLPGGGYTEFFDAAPGGNATIDGLWLPDGIVTGAKVAAAIKDAAATTAALRTLGAGATQAAAGDHSHSALPTAAEKAALVGTTDAPSSTNRYVTDADATLRRSRLTTNLADSTTLDDVTDNTVLVNNLIATLSASASASQPKTLRFGEGILRTTGMKPAKNVILDARGCHIKKIGQDGSPQQNSLLRALETQVGGSYYGTYSGVKVLGGTWDANGYACPSSIFRLLFTEGLLVDGPTILATPRVATGVGTTDASAAITGPANTFSSADAGRPISGTGIPGGAKILSVASGTSATMSANATATGTITLTLGTIWQTAFGGRDGRVEHVTTRGATMVFQDGLHHCHGPNWTYAHNDVESGDDALAVGLGSGDVYLAAEVANGTYDAMKNIVFLDNHVTSWRGHAFRAYQIAGDTNPAWRITDIEVLATTGRAGILRNGGYYIESLMGSDGVQMIQRVNIEGAPLEVGSAAHDDVNGFGALVSGASDVTIDPVAIRVTEKSNAVASVVTTAGSTAITAPAGSFSPSDVGRSIWGTNIPIATTLAAVASDTAATLSGNASASGTATATVGAVVGFDLVKVYSSPDCKIGGLKPGALQIKRFALDVNASDRFKLDDYKLTHGPFVPQSPVRLRDSPDFDLGRGELLELRNGATGITLAAGTANTNSGSIHDARVKHVAGASLGYAVNPTTTGLTKLSLRDNDFSGAAQGGVGPALPTAIPSFKATGNRGVVDYPAATPRVATAVNYTALASDGVVAVTSTATPRTITLPAASAMSPGAPLTVKDESGAAVTNNITISRAGTDTIEGAITKVISTNYGTVTLYSTGSVWMVA